MSDSGSTADSRSTKVPKTNMGYFMSMGVALGAGVGAAIDNVAIGVGVGLAVGAGLGGVSTILLNRKKD